MPELAEVFHYAHQWDPGVGGRITEVEMHPRARVFRDMEHPGALVDELTRRRLLSIRTHGKRMLFGFSGGRWLYGHLGMSGELRREPPDYRGGKHDHLLLRQGRHCLVCADPRMFGNWALASGSGLPESWEDLPPEVLSDRFTRELLATRLGRRPRTPLKSALLLQETFPGIGNWMADEILWRCRWHPALPCGRLGREDVGLLRRELRRLCRQALRIIGDGWGTPPRSWLFLHRWEDGGGCPRCGELLVREPLGGRTTCRCPRCQPG